MLAGQPESPTAQVAIVGVDGKGLRTLASGSDPAWSPLGERIAYALADDRGASLRTVDVATGAITVLYTAPAGAALTGPAWAGNRAWVFVQDGDIWRLDAGTDVPERLTIGLAIEPSLEGGPLAVSADGNWIAVGTGLGATARVGLVWVDGGAEVDYPWPGRLRHPRWAPEPVPEAPATAAPTPSEPAPSAKAPASDLPVGWVWTAATVQAVAGRPGGLVEAVTAGGPGFVAVGRGCINVGESPACEGAVWTSTDGREWARAPASDATDIGATFPTSGPELGMYDVAAGAPGIVAVGYAARPDMQATIWFSPDASSWERIPLGPDGPGTAPDDPMGIRVEAVTWDGTRFVVVGADRTDLSGRSLGKAKARAAVWTSSDGLSWARVPHTADLKVGGFVDTLEDPATGGMFDVISGPAGLVAVGSVCNVPPAGCQPAVWTSADGTTWERSSDMPDAAGVLGSVAASSAGYLAVGTAACDACQALAFTSFDGQSWAPQSFDRRHDFTTVAAIGDMLFAIAAAEPTTVWTSDDGEVWLQSGVAGGPTTGGGSEWHLAATPDTAVWLGSTAASDLPEAWVSEGQASP